MKRPRRHPRLRHPRRADSQLARHALRNQVLRPSPYLGFAEADVGVHLMRCGAYALAERFFREAIWLNPYTPAFKVHLASSLYEQRRLPEAIAVLTEVLRDFPGDAAAHRLLQMSRRRLGGSPPEMS